MRTLPSVLFTALALIGPGYVSAADPSPPPPPDPLTERMGQAIRLVQSGEFNAALEQFIEPTIAQFEKEYAGNPAHIYCARSPEEAQLYMIQAAAKNQNALAIGSAYAYAYYLKGYILVDRDDLSAARPFLQKAVDLSPSNAMFLSELGHVFQQAKEWQKALDTFDRAIEGARTFPDNANHSEMLRRALRGRGYSLIESDRLDEAEKVYAECLELEPNDRTAKGELEYIKGLRLKPAAAK